MGKRELLLIAVFVVVGTLIYQASAPARQPGQTGFSFGRIMESVRREVRGNRGRAEMTTEATHLVPPGIGELRLSMRSVPITIVGEARTDIASEFWVRSNGIDNDEAKKLAGETVLKIEPAGPSLVARVAFPDPGSQQARLTLRVPSRLLVQIEPSVGRLDISGVAGVELENARGETTVKQVAGRVAVTHRGGDLVIEDAASLRLNTRGSEVRVARVRGEAVLQLVAGDIRATELTGPVEIDATATDVTLEGLEQMKGALRINAVEGVVTLRGLRSEARIDGQESELDVTIDQAAPIAIFNTGERVLVTPPLGGYTLDAVASGAKILLPEALGKTLQVTPAADGKEERASGPVNGGGATITVRSTRGEIRVNARQ